MLEDRLLPEQLQALAGDAAFKRGEAYFREGRVDILVDAENRLDGDVAGSGRHVYHAQIEAAQDDLRWQCSCPMGAQSDFCKHLVALALARLASGDEPLWVADDVSSAQVTKPAKAKRRSKEDELRAFLEEQDKTRLLDWLLDAARSERAVRDRLLLAARAAGPSSELKKLVTEMTRVQGFLDYQEMPDFARRIHALIDTLSESHGAELMGLSEYAVERLYKALETCDDSDGYMTELIERLVELHVRASLEAKPEPTAFAAWLFHAQIDDDWGTWPGPEAYQEVLGANGLAAYTQLARAAWDKLPTRQPGNMARDDNRYCLTRIMESLARIDGRPEAMADILAKDLSSSYAFLRIAEVFHNARRHDEALDWAERGLAAFPKMPDGRLQDFLVDEYFRRGRKDAAMDIAWRQFSGRRGGADEYKKLIARSQRTDAPEVWRRRALASLRDEALRQHAEYQPLFGTRPAHPNFTTLVEALLWDKDLENALTEARSGLCDARTLVHLARALSETQPDAAISLYKRAIHPIADLKTNSAYAEAADIARAVGKLLKAANRAKEFGDWLAEVRLAHKPKRNFMKLLDTL